ncbi:uncharacterized protein METZ01_LOCUS495648, partial [marine metagenome]
MANAAAAAMIDRADRKGKPVQPDQQRTSMKALYYLLITSLLTITSYGADKPIPSLNGFEGWGKDGVNIIV